MKELLGVPSSCGQAPRCNIWEYFLKLPAAFERRVHGSAPPNLSIVNITKNFPLSLSPFIQNHHFPKNSQPFQPVPSLPIFPNPRRTQPSAQTHMAAYRLLLTTPALVTFMADVDIAGRPRAIKPVLAPELTPPHNMAHMRLTLR